MEGKEVERCLAARGRRKLVCTKQGNWDGSLSMFEHCWEMQKQGRGEDTRESGNSKSMQFLEGRN